MSIALKPLLRIALTFAIVWFYSALLPPLSPIVRVFVLLVLAIPTWLVVSRLLFSSTGRLSVIRDEFDDRK